MSHSVAARGTCHCGRIEIVLSPFPPTVTECNCSLCRRYGVLWAYVDADAVQLLPMESMTQTYSWNGRHVDFHRCRHCGCLTHWMPRDQGRSARGINARLFSEQVLAGAARVFKDGASK